MGSVEPRLSARLHLAALPLVLAFVVLVGYVPHLDVTEDVRAGTLPNGLIGMFAGYAQWFGGDRDDYEYTLHVDENEHWARMAQLQREDQARFSDPFTGEPAGGDFQLRGSTHERGFHVALAQFQEITGIPWPIMFRFLPALWMGVTAWMVWALLRPWPGAPMAAAFVALMPTSARFIGPSFLVPIGFGLAWIPLVLLLTRETVDRRRSPFLLTAALSWSFFVHFVAGIAALGLALLMLPQLTRRRRAALLLGLTVLPAAWLAKNFIDEIAADATRIGFLPNDRTIFLQLGAPFLVAWVLGLLLFYWAPPREHRAVLMPFAMASLIVFLMIVSNLAFDLNNYFLYERWHQIFALFATVPLAHGLGVTARAIRNARLRTVGPKWVAPGIFLVLAGGLVLSGGVEWHMKERYYHVIDDADFASFEWAGENLPAEYDKFLTHPWKAPILTAITGKQPVAFLRPGTAPFNGAAYDAYRGGGHGDGVFLVQNDVTWIADTAQPATAAEYQALGGGLYGLRPDLLAAYRSAVTSPDS